MAGGSKYGDERKTKEKIEGKTEDAEEEDINCKDTSRIKNVDGCDRMERQHKEARSHTLIGSLPQLLIV